MLSFGKRRLTKYCKQISRRQQGCGFNMRYIEEDEEVAKANARLEVSVPFGRCREENQQKAFELIRYRDLDLVRSLLLWSAFHFTIIPCFPLESTRTSCCLETVPELAPAPPWLQLQRFCAFNCVVVEESFETFDGVWIIVVVWGWGSLGGSWRRILLVLVVVVVVAAAAVFVALALAAAGLAGGPLLCCCCRPWWYD